MANINIETVEPFGRLRQEVANFYDAYLDRVSEHFEWLEQIVEQTKAAFQKPEVELLPKTPSEKRTRSRIKAGSIRKPESTAKRQRSSAMRKSPMVQKMKAAILAMDQASSGSYEGVPQMQRLDSDIGALATCSADDANENIITEQKEEMAVAEENGPNPPAEFVCPEPDSAVEPPAISLEPKSAIDTQQESAINTDPKPTIDTEPKATIDTEPKATIDTELKPASSGTAAEPNSECAKAEAPTQLREGTPSTPQRNGRQPVSTPVKTQPPITSGAPSGSNKGKLASVALTPRLTPSSQPVVKRMTPQKSASQLTTVALETRGEKIRQHQQQQLKDAAVKRDELLRQRIEEQKRKREERALKVAQLRLVQKAKEDELKRKIEEKYQTPGTIDNEEKRKLRPRFPNSAAKPQENELKKLMEIERAAQMREQERVEANQKEMKRMHVVEHEEPPKHTSASVSKSSIRKGSNATDCSDYKSAKTSPSKFEEPKDVSLAKVSAPAPNRATFCVAASSNSAEKKQQQQPVESYDMTPLRDIKPSTTMNYDISDLRSSDETDDEEQPRKKVPGWAQGTHLKTLLRNQYHNPPDLDDLFGVVKTPDLATMFSINRKRFYTRTSSAKWDSPIHPHGVRDI